MEKQMHAFVDEFGAFGFDFANTGCSSHFIISAIIVNEQDLDVVSRGVENIRRIYFQQGEMKSSKIGRNHKRRITILNELKKLPFHIFAVWSYEKSVIYWKWALGNRS